MSINSSSDLEDNSSREFAVRLQAGLDGHPLPQVLWQVLLSQTWLFGSVAHFRAFGEGAASSLSNCKNIKKDNKMRNKQLSSRKNFRNAKV